ncbi:MAG: RloB domain-containing protein [Saprospiraceae bacterium]|nr:RloB domain-containing protein [Saprospiraceae bacterium]
MPKRNNNRAYKRAEGHRDARLFIIVAEGEREDLYFGWFDRRNQRIRVQLVPREGQASAPKHFIARINQYFNSSEDAQSTGDYIWFVLDIDRWTRESINELIEFCRHTENWHIAISNPCFEVWLNFHGGALPEAQSCDDLKTLLNSRIRGGFHPNTICPLINTAIEYAKAADTHPDQDFPDNMQTKVYKLAEQMLEVLGRNWV